jgi:hypothetical protein
MSQPQFLFIGGDADGEWLQTDGREFWQVVEREPEWEQSPFANEPISETIAARLYEKQPFRDRTGHTEFVYVHNEVAPLARLIEGYNPDPAKRRHSLPLAMHDKLLAMGLAADFRGRPISRMTREDLIVCLMMVAGGA